MKSLRKILAWAAGLLAALALLVVVAVAVLFDPKAYQPLLEQSVREATGRTLQLQGELGLDFFPCCSVTLGPAALGNPPGFPAGDFARVRSASLGIRLWPLLARREVAIGQVRLDGLEADLLARADGRANWEFDGAASAAAGPAAAGGDGVRTPGIQGLRVTGGRLRYRDEQDASAYLVEDLELETGRIAAGTPFDLRLGGRVTEEAAGITATLALAATATAEPGSGRLTLAKPLLDFSAAGKGLPARGLTGKLGAAQVVASSAAETALDFTSLEGEFGLPGLQAVAGDASGSFVAPTARLAFGGSTELVVPQITVEVTATGQSIPGDTVSATLKATDVAVDADKLLGAVGALEADVNGLGARLLVTGGGRLAESGATLKGTLKLDPVSPRSVLAVLREPEPRTRDATALTRLSGTADWALGRESLALSRLDARLDDSRITGSLSRGRDAQPVTRFDLRVDALDADRYRAPEAGADAGAGGAAGKGAPAEEDIPVATIRGLRLDGRLAVGALAFGGVKLSDVTATVRAADGRLRLDPVGATLYGGRYRGSVSVDARGDTAVLATEQSLAGLQLAGALKDLYDSGKLTGALSGRVSAQGRGNTSDALLRTLDGDVALSLADGAWLGTDLWHEIRKARARLKGDVPPPAPADPRTPLQAAELAGTLADGVLTTQRLFADIPFMRFSAEGALDLVGKRMDYRARAQVLADPVFEDGTTLKDLKGVTIPVTLKGPLAKPDVAVDLKGLAASAATQKLLQRLNKKLGGEEPAGGAPPLDGAATGSTAPPADEKPRDALKRQLRDLFKPRE